MRYLWFVFDENGEARIDANLVPRMIRNRAYKLFESDRLREGETRG
jgi:hypothetical protein